MPLKPIILYTVGGGGKFGREVVDCLLENVDAHAVDRSRPPAACRCRQVILMVTDFDDLSFVRRFVRNWVSVQGFPTADV